MIANYGMLVHKNKITQDQNRDSSYLLCLSQSSERLSFLQNWSSDVDMIFPTNYAGQT